MSGWLKAATLKKRLTLTVSTFTVDTGRTDALDEWQWDCAIEDVERLRGCMLESFTEAGEQLGLRVKIEGSTAVGLNWGDTH